MLLNGMEKNQPVEKSLVEGLKGHFLETWNIKPSLIQVQTLWNLIQGLNFVDDLTTLDQNQPVSIWNGLTQ